MKQTWAITILQLAVRLVKSLEDVHEIVRALAAEVQLILRRTLSKTSDLATVIHLNGKGDQTTSWTTVDWTDSRWSAATRMSHLTSAIETFSAAVRWRIIYKLECSTTYLQQGSRISSADGQASYVPTQQSRATAIKGFSLLKTRLSITYYPRVKESFPPQPCNRFQRQWNRRWTRNN